jgi:Mrp family chromosome partitioning ATPase
MRPPEPAADVATAATPQAPPSASRAPRLRPSWLKVNAMKSSKPSPAAVAAPDSLSSRTEQANFRDESREESSGILQRMRQRLHRRESKKTGNVVETAAAAFDVPDEAPLPSTRPNDLRHYLQQRMASAQRLPAKDASTAPSTAPRPVRAGNGRVGPVLTSLDTVINHVFAAAKGEAPHALLVASAAPKTDSAPDAIELSRALVAKHANVLLIDLTRGASAVSGVLGLPRSPGFTDLMAGRVGFGDVIRVDPETALQIIPAGNPAIKVEGDEVARFGTLFNALTQAYDCVVLHADNETAQKFKPALRLELPVMVAVLPSGASEKGNDEDLTGFLRLGCPIVVYEQTGKRARSGFLGRVASL